MSRHATAKAALGAAVRSAREATGLSIGDLAERVGTTYGYVWSVERGQALPRRERVVSLARALGADPDAWLDIVTPGHEESRERHSNALRLAHTPEVRARATATLRAVYIRKADPTRSRLTAARVALDLTVTELARRSGAHPSRICSLELGDLSPRTTVPDEWSADARDIADALATTCDALWPEHAPTAPRLPRAPAPLRPDELYDAEQTADAIRAAVARLTPQQQIVMTVRFGLDGGEPGDIGDMAPMLGVSKQRVSQVEHAAYERLATLLKEHRP